MTLTMTPNSEIAGTLEKLKPKQKAFVLEYVKQGNGVAAARAAGYRGTDAILRSIASQNLTKLNIRRAIEEFTKPIFEEAGVTVKALVNELARYAFAPLEDFAKLKYNREGEIIGADLNLRDKLTAIKMLGDHIGLFSAPADAGEKPISLNFHVNMTGEEARQKLLEYLRNRRR